MAQGYYTLPEAAKYLGMPLEDLKQMAQKGQIRSFQDRGTLRFRIQDVQELAHTRGVSSDPELVLGEPAPPPKSSATPPSGGKKSQASPKSPAKKQAAPEVFNFDLDDSVDLGADVTGPKSKPSSKGKKSPSPVPGSDSDVRLVADGSDVTFSAPKDSKIKLADSDVKVAPDPLQPKSGVHTPPSSSGKRAAQMAVGSGAQPKSKAGGSSATKPVSPKPGNTPQPVDSGVGIIPMDSDSDVKLLGSSDDVPLGEGDSPSASDSNVRLERAELPPADSHEGNLHLTEEINLDEELRKHQEKDKDQPSTKLKRKSQVKLPGATPFELSDSDLEMPAQQKETSGPKTPKKAKPSEEDSSDFDLKAQQASEGSSDFDLVPASDGTVLVDGESKDFSLELSDENELVLQDEHTELTSSTSGINLSKPADAGISLEDSGEEAGDFDLSLEIEDTPKPAKSKPIDDSSSFELGSHKTPRPGKSKPVDDSESEFELTLDSDADEPVVEKKGDSSEFELNLEGSGEVATSDSDSSEFELTLDDSGSLSVEDEEAPQVKSKGKPRKPGSSSDQDIFDTDFEVPALDSSDEQTAADSELESSDFDLALDDSELAAEEESGSAVVALDEETETLVDSDGDAAVVDDVEVEEESSDFQDLDQDVQVDEDEGAEVEEEAQTVAAGRTVIKEKLIAPAPWGALPVVFMLPCVLVMFMVGILGFELVQTSAGLKPPGVLTLAIADIFGQKVSPK